MTVYMSRHLELVNLTGSLQQYAGSLQGDVNAAFLLVHRVLAAALRNSAAPHTGYGPLESSLRRDIDRAYAAAPRTCNACA